MRPFLIGCAVTVFASWGSPAFGQPGQDVEIQYGWNEKIVRIRELPPDVRADLRKQTNQYLAIGYCYRHWYLLGEGFDFWTWNGRYVLFHDEQYWEVTDEQLLEMIGREAFDSLGKPLRYRFPLGIVVVLVFAAAIGGCIYFFPLDQKRVSKLLQNGDYKLAVEKYYASLPSDSEPEEDDRRSALATAVEFLQTSRPMASDEAESHLRLIIGEMDRQRAEPIRHEAGQYEQAGQWEDAIELYRAAAALREDWDPKDHAFLMSCIQRVQKKQSRSRKR